MIILDSFIIVKFLFVVQRRQKICIYKQIKKFSINVLNLWQNISSFVSSFLSGNIVPLESNFENLKIKVAWHSSSNYKLIDITITMQLFLVMELKLRQMCKDIHGLLCTTQRQSICNVSTERLFVDLVATVGCGVVLIG